METAVMPQANTTVIHRGAFTPAWWTAGLVLLAVGYWGLPLIQSDQFENHFFGLFYYSILAGVVLFWACPSEQRFIAASEDGDPFEQRFVATSENSEQLEQRHVAAGKSGGQFERHTTILGVATLWRQVTPLSAFSQIHFEQDPNLFRKDTVWVIVAGEGDNAERFAFANFSATAANIDKAKAIAQALSQATGLPISNNDTE